MASTSVDESFLTWWNEACEAIRRIRLEDQAQAPRFNVFHILQADRDEVRTHSRLIAALLDPGGTHGQGTMFLKPFLSHPEFKELARHSSDDRWEVAVEEPHGHYGRFDIVLRLWPERIVILIENKVDAIERERQCDDYLDWLDDQKRNGWTGALVFLTPDGRPAQSVTGDRDYVALSYPQLAALLGSEVTEQTPANVREVLEQYLHVARTLTTSDLGGLIMASQQKLADFLSSGENLEYAFQVADAIDTVRERSLDRFFEGIGGAVQGRIGDGWRHLKEVTPKEMSVSFVESQDDPLRPCVQLYGGQRLFGLAWRDKRGKEERAPTCVSGLREAAAEILGESRGPDDWWLIWRSDPMTLQEVHTAGPEAAREVGRIMGDLIAAVGDRVRRANEALRG